MRIRLAGFRGADLVRGASLLAEVSGRDDVRPGLDDGQIIGLVRSQHPALATAAAPDS